MNRTGGFYTQLSSENDRDCVSDRANHVWPLGCVGIYLAPEELFRLYFKTKIGRYFETIQLIVSVSRCRSHNIVCNSASVKSLCITDPPVPTTDDGTQTHGHPLPQGSSRAVGPMVI